MYLKETVFALNAERKQMCAVLCVLRHSHLALFECIVRPHLTAVVVACELFEQVRKYLICVAVEEYSVNRLEYNSLVVYILDSPSPQTVLSAIIGGLVGGLAGCTAGAAFGDALDQAIFDNYKCIDCDYTFSCVSYHLS